MITCLLLAHMALVAPTPTVHQNAVAPDFSPDEKLIAVNVWTHQAIHKPESSASSSSQASMGGPQARVTSDSELRNNQAKWKNAEAITLTGKSVTDAALVDLAIFQKLHSLKVRDTKITNAGLRELAKLKNLRVLDLDVSVTNEGMAHLAQHARLKQLKADLSQMTGPGWAEFGKLKELKFLHCGKLSDEGFAALANYTTLDVALSVSGISDRTMNFIARLTNLKELSIGGESKLSDAGLRDLARLQNLEMLWMSGEMSLKGLREIGKLKKLRALSLSAGADEGELDETIRILAGISNLEVLNAYSSQMSDKGLVQLAKLKKLKVLILSGDRVTNGGMCDVAKFENLEWLWLRGTAVSDNGLNRLTVLKKLKHVDITNLVYTEDTLTNLKKSLPNCYFNYSGEFYPVPNHYWGRLWDHDN